MDAKKIIDGINSSKDYDDPESEKDLTTKINQKKLIRINNAEKKSPLRLTEKGEEVRDSIRATELVSKYEQELETFIDVSKTKNAYDVQQEAFRVVSENFYKLLSEKEMNLLKNEAYKIGDTIEAILIVFQIIFRDVLLKKYNLLIKDIDKR